MVDGSNIIFLFFWAYSFRDGKLRERNGEKKVPLLKGVCPCVCVCVCDFHDSASSSFLFFFFLIYILLFLLLLLFSPPNAY